MKQRGDNVFGAATEPHDVPPDVHHCTSNRGWQLYEGQEGRLWFARRRDALQTASLMASAVHRNHGIPTAVIVDLAGCEAVMVAAHG